MDATGQLARRLSALQTTQGKVESLHSSGGIARRDVERVYEGLYIAAITTLEGFLEALFYDVVLNHQDYAADIRPRAQFRSRQVLRDVVLGDRPYVNWLPFDRTLARASTFLRGGRPFSAVNGTDKRLMQDWIKTRHAIAHTSAHADRVFLRDVVRGIPLPPRQRTPAGFLRSQLRPGVSRFENVLREMEGIARKIG